jgi:hypothetical protein
MGDLMRNNFKYAKPRQSYEMLFNLLSASQKFIELILPTLLENKAILRSCFSNTNNLDKFIEYFSLPSQVKTQILQVFFAGKILALPATETDSSKMYLCR